MGKLEMSSRWIVKRCGYSVAVSFCVEYIKELRDSGSRL